MSKPPLLDPITTFIPAADPHDDDELVEALISAVSASSLTSVSRASHADYMATIEEVRVARSKLEKRLEDLRGEMVYLEGKLKAAIAEVLALRKRHQP